MHRLAYILMMFNGFTVADGPRSKSNSGSERKTQCQKDGSGVTISAQTFTFRELAAATGNFRPKCLIGEGGFGRVYKGYLESTGKVIIISTYEPFILFLAIDRTLYVHMSRSISK